MARNGNSLFVTAILSAGLAVGSLGAASAHHGDVSDHSTTKGKNLAEIEQKERQITAELNRRQAQGQQLAFAQTPQAPPMTQQTPSAQMPQVDMPPAAEAEAEEEEAAGAN